MDETQNGAAPPTSRARAARLLGIVAVAAFVALPVDAGSTSVAGHANVFVRVAFLQGEQLVQVRRRGATPSDAVTALIAGPTPAEKARGFRTYIAPDTHLLRLTTTGSIATVDLSRAFASGSAERRTARLAQLVRTVTGLRGITRVQLLVNGLPAIGLAPGISLAHPITLRLLETPNIPVPSPPPLRLPAPDPETKALQGRLIELGYLLPGDNDGRFGPATSDALLAFQKWERLDRTGGVDSRTKTRLATATRPTPVSGGGNGRRAEVLLDRQVALLIKDDQVVRAIAVSTGKASTPTPPGNYRVYAKIPRWWSTPFREWLPYALPFVGGIAFHELQDVPAYPASHGCVRQRYTVAPWTYTFAYVGMPVKVIARS